MADYVEIDSVLTVGNGDSCLTLLISEDSEIRYELTEGFHELLVVIRNEHPITLKESGYVDGAELKITYISLSDSKLDQQSEIDVRGHAKLTVDSYYLVDKKKTVRFDLFNRCPDSAVYITNSAVCLDGSVFDLNVIGTIVKGAKRAKCHQTSRCLTIGKPKKLRADPVLKIDENDVEASHALSSGTIDDDVLYYMNSRGLTRKEALVLLVQGYLLPDSSDFQQFEKGVELLNEEEEKVQRICSM